jgi:hypothetical protein
MQRVASMSRPVAPPHQTGGVRFKAACLGLLVGSLTVADLRGALAQAPATRLSASDSTATPTASQPVKELIAMADDKPSTSITAEMKAAAALTTKVLAIGSWTAKATPEARLPIMPFEARDTLRLELAGKIDEWFAKTDGSGAVFLMNVTDTADAHRLLEKLPLGQAGMMTFELIPVGPLWPLGLLLSEPAR